MIYQGALSRMKKSSYALTTLNLLARPMSVVEYLSWRMFLQESAGLDLLLGFLIARSSHTNMSINLGCPATTYVSVFKPMSQSRLVSTSASPIFFSRFPHSPLSAMKFLRVGLGEYWSPRIFFQSLRQQTSEKPTLRPIRARTSEFSFSCSIPTQERSR